MRRTYRALLVSFAGDADITAVLSSQRTVASIGDGLLRLAVGLESVAGIRAYPVRGF